MKLCHIFTVCIHIITCDRRVVVTADGHLYNQFANCLCSLLVSNKGVLVQGLGCLVWQDVAHRVMVVTPQGHSEVKRFWKRQRSHT